MILEFSAHFMRFLHNEARDCLSIIRRLSHGLLFGRFNLWEMWILSSAYPMLVHFPQGIFFKVA